MLCGPDLDAFSSLEWKVPSFVYADGGADMYLEGMRLTAFPGSLHRSRRTLVLSPCVYEMAPTHRH